MKKQTNKTTNQTPQQKPKTPNPVDILNLIRSQNHEVKKPKVWYYLLSPEIFIPLACTHTKGLFCDTEICCGWSQGISVDTVLTQVSCILCIQKIINFTFFSFGYITALL